TATSSPRTSRPSDLVAVLECARRALDGPEARHALAWLEERAGVSREVLDRYRVGLGAPVKVRAPDGHMVETFSLAVPSFIAGELSGIKLYRVRAREIGGEAAAKLKAISERGSRPGLVGGHLLREVAGRTVLVVGGEKDVLVAAAAMPESLVVANARGEGGWTHKRGDPLGVRLAREIVAAKPARVVVALDVNERERGARDAIACLHAAGATDVRLLGYPEDFAAAEPKGGVFQLVTARGAALLRELVQRAPLVPFAPPKPEAPKPSEVRLTDLGNARRLVRLHGRDLRFSATAGGWFTWTGQRWRRDETGEAERRAKSVPAEIFAEASELMSRASTAADEDERKKLANRAQELAAWAMKSESEPRLRALLALAESEPGIPVLAEDLDRDPFLLNVANGTIDLNTGELRPHRREDLITKLAPVAFDSAARLDRWTRFIDGVTGGKVELARFLQRLVGYALTGSTSEQVLALLYGTGANGKSTFLETLREVLGDYALQANFGTFLAAKDEGGPRNDVARLRGARLVTAIETKEGGRLNEGLVKTLTGGDTVTARFLYREEFEFVPSFKLFLASNHKPAIKGTDLGMWRRIRLVPFVVTFRENDPNPLLRKDPALREALRAELPGVLRWAVEGALAWKREGLGLPDQVRAATEGYREEQDTLGTFLAERCLTGDSARVSSSLLYGAFKDWALANGEKPCSQRAFSLRLSERGFEKKRSATGGAREWLRLGLLTLEDPTSVSFRNFSPTRADEESFRKDRVTDASSVSSRVAENGTLAPGWTSDPIEEAELDH
ncbi:MAG TPA: phage/plasmid primase, P4 family, partial [Planctomycetota bacterium]|nr:phage/plasmid primase, P4 family [Planctomycetota bacterium]